MQVTKAMPSALALQPELLRCAQLRLRASLPFSCLALLFQAFPLPPLGYTDGIQGERPRAAWMRVPSVPMRSGAGAGERWLCPGMRWALRDGARAQPRCRHSPVGPCKRGDGAPLAGCNHHPLSISLESGSPAELAHLWLRHGVPGPRERGFCIFSL